MKHPVFFTRFLSVLCAAAFLLVMFCPAGAFASTVRITEWMYKGGGGEFVELTNAGDAAVDFTGWSYDDDSRTPGGFDLSGFGILAPGESAIFTEASDTDFRTEWGLDATVKVLGLVENNIGKSDEINIYDGSDTLVDRLTYEGDTIKTEGFSGNPLTAAALGANDDSLWVLAHAGDRFGSWVSNFAAVGNPGAYNPVPVPGAFSLMAFGILALAGLKRRKN